MLSKWTSLSFYAVAVALIACGPAKTYDDPYMAAVYAAPDSTVVETFGGIKLGMTNEEFRTHCLKSQQAGTMYNGTNNMVAVDLDTTFASGKITIEFLPEQDDSEAQVIQGMAGRVFAQAWSPWNKGLSADSILPRVEALFLDELGGQPFIDFSGAHLPTRVKIDGSRRIALRPHPTEMNRLQVSFVDLRVVSDSVRHGEDLRVKPYYMIPRVSPQSTAKREG